MIFTTFLNILAPISGSTIVNPVTAYFTDLPRAIAIGSILFALNGVHRVWLFRKHIFEEDLNRKIIKTMLPISVCGAILGGFFISFVNEKLLAFIVILVALYFIGTAIASLRRGFYKVKVPHKYGLFGVALLSGFLQASGMPGSDIRNNYLRSHIKETSIRGVGSAIGMVNFAIGGSILALHSHLLRTDIIFIVTLFPVLIIVQYYGKKVLDKMKGSHAKVLSILLSLLGVILLFSKYFV